MDPTDKIQGAIIGHLIADALNIAKEDRIISRLEALQLLARHYGESGASMLCVLESLIQNDTFDLQDIAESHFDWFITSSAVSGRDSLSEAIRMFSNGTPPERCGQPIEDDGALIRVLPLAFWPENLSQVILQSHELSKFTTYDIESHVCAVICLLVAHWLAYHKKEPLFEFLADFYDSQGLSDYAEITRKIKAEENALHGLTTHTLWISWAEIKKAKNFEDSLIHFLVNHQQVDPCLLGSWLGIRFGYNGLPRTWKNQLYLSSAAKQSINNFVKSAGICLTKAQEVV